MHRIKIGLIASIVLVVLTVVFHGALTSSLLKSAQQDVESRVSRAQRVFRDINQLNGLKLANLAATRGRMSAVASVFDKADATAKQTAAYEISEVINQQLKAEGKKADIVAIFDASGKIVGRDLNPNADVGVNLAAQYPAVAQALKGIPVKDVWTWQGRVHDIAVAPVLRPDNSVVGGVLLAWVVSATQAQSSRDLLDVELGFFHAGKVYASSFVSNMDRTKEDATKSQLLSNLLYDGQKLAASTLDKGSPSEVKSFELEGKKYAAVVAPMPGNFADKTSGYVVLASISDASTAVNAAGMTAIYLGVLAIVVALLGTVLTARRFIGPLDQIELGVAEVINGNIDYSFKPVGQDFEGLSNSLNVMLSRLLGREEPNEEAVEEDESKKAWKAESMVVEDSEGVGPAEVVAVLAQENEASYYPRLYNEYVATLRNLGQPAEGMTVLAFMAKLSLTEAGLREKWECKSVRFQLLAQGDTITFRPIKIS